MIPYHAPALIRKHPPGLEKSSPPAAGKSGRLRVPKTSLAFKRPLESDVQRAIVRLFEAFQFTCHSTSQYRASGQALGLPDLWLMSDTHRKAFFWEVKRPAAKDRDGNPYHPLRPWLAVPEPLRPKQVEFREMCLHSLTGHGWGTVHEARCYLVDELRLAEWTGPDTLIGLRRPKAAAL